ncbi:unnamed protein product [Rotaria sp. Silwood1]|nr:unnamed protein product [Rotaria sp. Silwood1]CAF3511373.1 unnamed protein product [Rotaria sp. Silwood1]
MYAVETALTVPILTSLRVPESFYSMAWLISPILGFFLQPIIGMWSDSCKCRWGRRRPFILAFAIGAYIGVALLLNSSDLGVLFGDSRDPTTTPYKAIVLTAVGVTFLDFCADSADAPVRAYLIDTTNSRDQERGFNIHAILGIGGGLGFIVGAIQWPYIPMLQKDDKSGEFSVVFYFATFLFIVCSISTLTSVREEPLISSSASSSSRDHGDTENTNEDDQREIEISEKRPLLTLRPNSSRSYNTTDKSTANMYLSGLDNKEGFIEIDPATGRHIPHDDVEGTSEDILLKTMERSHQLVAASLASADSSNTDAVPTQAFEAELKQKAKLVKLGLMRRPESEEKDDYDEKDAVTIKSMIISMVRMPSRLWKLMICQVIGWVAYFATHLYFTDFIATKVYNGTLDEKDPEAFDRYKYGVTMGCWGLLLYSASTAIYACTCIMLVCLERWLAEKFSLKTLYFVGYLAYAIGCLINFFVPRIAVNIIMCITFGMLVVSLNTLPYHMLSQFHADETYKNRDGSKRGIGVDCSLLNSCYFLGELAVAASLGPVLERTGVEYCMIVGTAFALFGTNFPLHMCDR